MTAEQLEELLGVLHYGKWPEQHQAIHKVRELAPSLARRVIAAEKLDDWLRVHGTAVREGMSKLQMAELSLLETAYREASK